MRIRWGLSAALLCAATASAWGHANLISPAPRDLEAHKTGPCGPTTRSATPTELVAGETLIVGFTETIEHPGYYRIAFAPAAETGFDENVLLDDIPDIQGGAMPHMYMSEVVVPDQPCEDCTIQLIQYMTETNPPSLYFSCADVIIRAAPGDDAGPGDAGGGGGPDAGVDSPDAGGNGSAEPGDPPGLCSVSTGSRHGGAGWLIAGLFAAAVLLRRRCR
jgi:hypothetical protein